MTKRKEPRMFARFFSIHSSIPGSRKDPYTNFLKYGIIVNKERTLIWLWPDGSWVVKPKHL